MTISPAIVVLEMDFAASCQVTPWPTAARVQWKLNDKALLLRPRLSKSDTAHMTSVVEDRASERLAGRWVCEVTHQGEVWRASATLTVQGEFLLTFLFFVLPKDVLSDVLLGFFRDNHAPGRRDQGVRRGGLRCHPPLCLFCCFEAR